MRYSRISIVGAAMVTLFLAKSSPVWSACTPGQLQSYFYGLLFKQKFRQGHELRAYINGVLVGTTKANPGRLQKIDDRLEFALYLCGEGSDVGATVEFRYARSGQEYRVKVVEGDPTFQGREIGVGSFPEVAEAKLVIDVTKKKVTISTGDGDTATDGDDGEEGSGTPGQEVPRVIDYDVDKDGRIDSNDAAIVLNHILFQKEDAAEDVDLRYDMNNDGVVDTEDVKEIYRHR